MDSGGDGRHFGGDEYAHNEDDDDCYEDEGYSTEPMPDVFGDGVAVGHQLAESGPDEHVQHRNSCYAQSVACQGDDAEVGARLAGAEQHPSAEHRRYEGGDAHIHRGVIARYRVLFDALPLSPDMGDAQVQECSANQDHRGYSDSSVKHFRSSSLKKGGLSFPQLILHK